MNKAVLSNYLWIRKKYVEGNPSDFAPEFEHHIRVLDTAEGKIAQQQINALREEARKNGDDPDEVAIPIKDTDMVTIPTWGSQGKWWKFCSGDIAKVKALAKRLKLRIEDKRVSTPWPEKYHDTKMVLSPKEEQIPALKEWMQANHGILKAAPAFGKTYVGIWSILQRRVYTIVLVDTDVLAEQFITRFRQGIRQDNGSWIPITNCLEVEEELGEKVITRLQTADDLAPVMVATYQLFLHENGRKLLEILSNYVGYVLLDECHVFAAESPADVVSRFKAQVRCGMSATPTRKDQLHSVLYDVVGPITAEGVADQLPIKAYMINTGEEYNGPKFPSRSDYTKIINWCCSNNGRNDLIFDWVKMDVSLGRNILIICDRVKWVIQTAKLFNRAGFRARAVVGGSRNKKSKEERETVINEMIEGEIQVICATKTFKAGVDIPNLDTLYLPLPVNNREQMDQMMGRIRRNYPGKRKPHVRYFVDEGHGLLYGCAKGTHGVFRAINAEIVLVQAGADPEKVMKYAEGIFEVPKPEALGAGKRKKVSLKAVANDRKGAVYSLFSDLSKEAREAKKYNSRR